MRLASLILLAVVALSGAPAAQAQTKAYVAGTASNAVVVIDTATQAVLGAISVGKAPTAVAIAADGARAYVSNRDSGSVSVIDTVADAVLAEIAVGASPGALAVAPDGRRVYVLLAAGLVQAIDAATNAVVATIPVSGSGGGIAVAPDGRRAYVASGAISVIDTATNTVVESLASGAGNARAVALSPDGTRAYFTTSGTNVFAGGAVVALDTAAGTVLGTLALGGMPGQIALAPDGGRAYVAIQSTWANLGYAVGFMPGRTVSVIDTATLASLRSIDLGAYNTAAGLAVTPDRSRLYAAIPRLASVAVVDTGTHAVQQLLAAGPNPGGLAIIPDPSATPKPHAIDAVDDQPASALPSSGGTAVANVLANDRLGGAPVALAQVELAQRSSTDARISLDTASGAVRVAAGAAVGAHTLVYRICERASPDNCDEATVSLVIRDRHVIDAVDDSATSFAGRTALASVLANDRLGGAAASTTTVKLAAVSSTHAGIVLNAATGAVSVAAGTPAGSYALVYRICELADPGNCDQASVNLTVMPNAIDAVNDAGLATTSGGIAVANVLANDTFAGARATLTTVTLAAVSSTSTNLSLNPATGAVAVAAGAPAGSHSLAYRICERANPANCDQASVTVTVRSAINAVNDSARAAWWNPGTALASVLANDSLGGARATTANVALSLVSLRPTTSLIRLDPSDGSVDVLGRLPTGLYVLTYRICEIASPSNCDTATVSLTISN